LLKYISAYIFLYIIVEISIIILVILLSGKLRLLIHPLSFLLINACIIL
jgi:hypothetical protein